MERHVAATLDLEQLDALPPQMLGRRQHVSGLRRAAERDHGWMLDKKQYILIHIADDARARHLPLQVECVAVRPAPEIDDEETAH